MSEAAPTTPTQNGRDPGTGRFSPGNGFSKGRGNPFNVRIQSYRAAMLAAVSPQDIAAVMGMLLERAREGDVAAAKELLNRCLGAPAQAVALMGPDGEALPGVNVQVLIGAVLTALAEHPEARLRVADRLKELSLAGPGDGTGAGA